MDQTLKKDRKIRKSREFKKVQQNAKKKHSKYFTLLYAKGRCRLGITVSAKVGNSPQRNYIKRCIREFFRCNKHIFSKLDVVVIVKPEMTTLNYQDICQALINTIQKKEK
jgi:ribonuclease P protein component